MKNVFAASVGAVGAAVTSLWGGWDHAILTLLIVMGVDYLTGLIVAGVFHRSPKTEGGRLESKAGLKGLLRKGGVLLVVLIAARLDLLLGAAFIRDAAVIAFTVNELLSVTENLGLMGVPIPKAVKNAIEALKKKE